MRDIFTSESNFNFKSELRLPRHTSATDIDIMIRGKREMLAAELKQVKVMPSKVTVAPTQYYTYKYLSIKGIPAFYIFKDQAGVCWVYYVDRHKEPVNNGDGLELHKKDMGRHDNLDKLAELFAQLIKAGDVHQRAKTMQILESIIQQKVSD